MFSTRVKELNDTDCQTLVRMINYLNTTKKNYLTLSDNDLKVIKWYVDIIFAVHPHFEIHTKAIKTMGQGAMHYLSRKLKLNKRIST